MSSALSGLPADLRALGFSLLLLGLGPGHFSPFSPGARYFCCGAALCPRACICWKLVASPSRADQECLQTSPGGGTESPSSGQKTGIVLSEPPQGPKHMSF